MVHKPSLANLSKLLNAYRLDGVVNISRKAGITTIRTMSDDYVTAFKCALHTPGEDYTEISIRNIVITAGEISGDKLDEVVRIARCPEFEKHLVSFNVDGQNFADVIQKHSRVITDVQKGIPCSATRMDIRRNLLWMYTKRQDVGVRELYSSRLNISETETLTHQLYDVKILYDTIFKCVTPEEITVRIQTDSYPLELIFNCGPVQCYYVQAHRVVI